MTYGKCSAAAWDATFVSSVRSLERRPAPGTPPAPRWDSLGCGLLISTGDGGLRGHHGLDPPRRLPKDFPFQFQGGWALGTRGARAHPEKLATGISPSVQSRKRVRGSY